MSRLTSMSPQALQAVFSPDSNSDLITLLTIYDPVNTGAVLARICDNYTTRISETADEVIYGVVSGGQNFTFLPVQVTLPGEEEAQAPRCSLSISDVTRYLTPIIRNLQGPPRVKLELVLNSTPSTVEVSFDFLYITSISYNRDVVNCELSMINLDREPFPLHSFGPQNFPGLF
jgi:hypothetical protein